MGKILNFLKYKIVTKNKPLNEYEKVCEECEGTGLEDVFIDCRECKGKGIVIKTELNRGPNGININ